MIVLLAMSKLLLPTSKKEASNSVTINKWVCNGGFKATKEMLLQYEPGDLYKYTL